jgi:hypothetical protein
MYLSDKGSVFSEKMNPYIGASQVLVDTNYIPKEILSGVADPTNEGYVNIFRRVQAQLLTDLKPTNYRQSYLSRMEAELGQSSEDSVTTATNVGWLIAASHGRPVHPRNFPGDYYRGSYSRLCNDGSVVRRNFRWHWITVEGKSRFAISVCEAFEDRP